MTKEARIAKALGVALARSMADLDARRIVHFLTEYARQLEVADGGEFLLETLAAFHETSSLSTKQH